MKEKTIKKILKGKFENLLKSIDDNKIKELFRKGTIITGGCITSMLLNEDVNDFDMYFKDPETAYQISNYYVKKFNSQETVKNKGVPVRISVKREWDRVNIVVKSAGIAGRDNQASYNYFEGLGANETESDTYIDSAIHFSKSDVKDIKRGEYKPIVLTSNAITLSSEVQLILRFIGSPEEIHKNYDFIHCTNYWTSWDGELVLNKEALLAIMTKELKYQGSLYPICSMFRVRKFIERGWTINAGQILKMAFQISKLDLEDILVLQDQLTGVDVAYFHELINVLKQEIVNGKTIDNVYISKLIDEIF